MIDEMKLDVLDHDVPIGGNPRKCCVDVDDKYGDCGWVQMGDVRRGFCRPISNVDIATHNPKLANRGIRLGFHF